MPLTLLCYKSKGVEKMAKKIRLGLLASLLAFCVLFAGCASLTWNAPVTEENTKTALTTALENAGAKEVASYTIVLGLFALGKSTFDGLAVGAVRSGKKIHILRVNNLFAVKIVAYAAD
jgi:hypothetical protein